MKVSQKKKERKKATVILFNSLSSEYIPKGSNIIPQKDVCAPIFIAALFTTAKIWKQLKCPLMDEFIRKLWCKYTELKLIQP